jgi:predicted PhzF superfamily epimerase YddE/YHI9
LCGHATLASAVVLLDTKRVLPTQTIHFYTLCVLLHYSHRLLRKLTCVRRHVVV